MSFRDAPWNVRVQAMGDLAENKFEEIWKTSFERWGLRRPRVNVRQLPARLRHAPDYLTSQGFIEVLGLGREQCLRLKVEKMNCLWWWSDLHPVSLFIYDSHHNRSAVIELSAVQQWIDSGQVTLGIFPERKAYWNVPASLIFDEPQET